MPIISPSSRVNCAFYFLTVRSPLHEYLQPMCTNTRTTVKNLRITQLHTFCVDDVYDDFRNEIHQRQGTVIVENILTTSISWILKCYVTTTNLFQSHHGRLHLYYNIMYIIYRGKKNAQIIFEKRQRMTTDTVRIVKRQRRKELFAYHTYMYISEELVKRNTYARAVVTSVNKKKRKRITILNKYIIVEDR